MFYITNSFLSISQRNHFSPYFTNRVQTARLSELKAPDASLGFILDLATRAWNPENDDTDISLSLSFSSEFCAFVISLFLMDRTFDEGVFAFPSLGMLTGRRAISESRFQFRFPFYREKRELECGPRGITRIAQTGLRTRAKMLSCLDVCALAIDRSSA